MNWISVNEKLPAKRQAVNISRPVLCACAEHPQEGGYFQAILYYDFDFKKWYLNFDTPVAWKIEYWMPLPNPPRP